MDIELAKTARDATLIRPLSQLVGEGMDRLVPNLISTIRPPCQRTVAAGLGESAVINGLHAGGAGHAAG